MITREEVHFVRVSCLTHKRIRFLNVVFGSWCLANSYCVLSSVVYISAGTFSTEPETWMQKTDTEWGKERLRGNIAREVWLSQNKHHQTLQWHDKSLPLLTRLHSKVRNSSWDEVKERKQHIEYTDIYMCNVSRKETLDESSFQIQPRICSS